MHYAKGALSKVAHAQSFDPSLKMSGGRWKREDLGNDVVELLGAS